MPVAPQTPVLTCPVCGQPLRQDARGADCAGGHHFDRAREGYLNLLRSSKAGDRTGDPKAAAHSRRAFLDKGYYLPLRDRLVALAGEQAHGTTGDGNPVRVLDICCGEGYYTDALAGVPGTDVYGFDLAKEMVRLAAKRARGHADKAGASYFVANLKAIPVADGAFDVATHLFAPFNAREFARVLRPGGTLLTVVPGARHLLGLKEVLYDTPYLNDERLPDADARACGLRPQSRVKVAADIVLASPEDIEAVFQMTPYYYRTRPRDRARLAGLPELATPVEFVIGSYRKEATPA